MNALLRGIIGGFCCGGAPRPSGAGCTRQPAGCCSPVGVFGGGADFCGGALGCAGLSAGESGKYSMYSGRRSLGRDRRTEEARMELEGKVALVTGASGGIGAAVARQATRGGGLGRAALGAATTSGSSARSASSATYAVARPSPRRRRPSLVHFGRLDIAVANAGVGAYGDFLDLDPEQVELMIDVNLKGTLYTAAAALPHLIDSGGGDFLSWRASPASAACPASPSTTRRSSASSASRARSTTSCASEACAPPEYLPRRRLTRTSRWGRAEPRAIPSSRA